jgi:hypothetical protein
MEELRSFKKLKELLPKEFEGLLLTNGKLSEVGLKSEYERGFVDCWNKLSPLILQCL